MPQNESRREETQQDESPKNESQQDESPKNESRREETYDEIEVQNLAALLGNEKNPRAHNDLNELVKKFEKFNWNIQTTSGGASKPRYKTYRAYLKTLNVKTLYKMAKKKGISITKKQNGKTVYVKKDTVIKKLCDAEYK